LGQNCFGPANIRFLEQDTELPNLQFRAHSLFCVVDWAGTHLSIDPKIQSLGREFNCSRHAIHSALANGLNEPKSRGRHAAVRAESDANMLAWITGKAEKNATATRTDIKNYCREVCKIEVRRRWVGSFISRHPAGLIEKKALDKKRRVCKFHQCFLIKLSAACMRRSRVVQSICYSIWAKSRYPTGKTDNRRRSWSREARRPIRFIIDYLGA
jgi:hypothetical protein